MTRATCFLEKALIIALLVFFTGGCASERFLLQKKDLSGVNTEIDLLEDKLEQQSAKTDRLMDQYIKQQQLLNESMEQNTLSFQALEKQIKEAHNDTCQKLDALKSSADEDPDLEDRPLLENVGTDKLVVGRAENVRLTPPGHIFPARIDTGATTSSLDARDLEAFERDGDPWVRFKLKDTEEDNLYEIEKEVVRHVRILQASSPEPERRPVIELQFQLGGIKMVEEFNLEQREHLTHKVLIGRNILRDLMVVDVAQKFIAPLPEENKNGDAGK
ncbi:MAG: RimK/LysX family protein [Desulfurivibrionaceae bacterium]